MLQHFLILKFYLAKNYEEYIGECGGESKQKQEEFGFVRVSILTQFAPCLIEGLHRSNVQSIYLGIPL